jgi:prepilin-type N-terminal cleavage/methylation domain-containing protein
VGRVEDWTRIFIKGAIMKTYFRTTKKATGYTLMEVMAVVCLIGILAAIAIPGFSAWVPDYRLKKAARDLYSNLQRAKMGAIRNNSEWRVYFDSDAERYLLCSDPGGDSTWGSDDDAVEITVNLSDYKGVDFGIAGGASAIGDDYVEAPAGTNPATNFTPRGTVDFRGYIYLSNAKGTCYAVGTPSPAGVIVLRRWLNGAWR